MLLDACLFCSKQLRTQYQTKYCSVVCQLNQQHRMYIESWKKGVKTGERGVRTKNISSHIKKYLFVKFNAKCSMCGWGKINPVTGQSPLEVDHIDGNSDNNSEENLRLICPNCHSLTPSYKALNKGKGRAWRRAKYLKI